MTDIQILDTYGYTMCPARSECPTSHHEKLGPYRVRSDVVAPHRFSDEFIVGHHEHSSTLGFTERNRRRRRCGRNGCPEPDGNAEAPARGHIGISAAFPKNRTRELSRAGSLGVPNHIHREWRPAVKRFSHRFKFRCRCSGRDQLASASAATSPSSVTLRRGWSRRPRPGPFRPTSPGALRPGSAAPGCWRFLQQSRPCLSRDEFVKRLKVVLHLFQLVRCARGGNIERSHELEVRAHLALNFLT